jgi:hypothetical protein
VEKSNYGWRNQTASMKDQDCRIWPVIVSIIRRGPFIGEAALAGEQTFFQRSSAWRTAFKMKMKSRGEPTSPSVATIASSFISSAVT